MDLDSLREAARLSPDNPPLLKILAEAEMAAFNLENVARLLDTLERLVPHESSVKQLRQQLDNFRQRLLGLAPLAPSEPAAPQAPTSTSELPTPTAPPAPPRIDFSSAIAPEESPSLSDIDAMLADVERNVGSRPRTTFADVGGLENVKEDIRRRILHPLQHPELYKQYGRQAGGGILLYGPPGCGKSLLARAIAGEINARWMEVGIHEILDMWVGNSEKNLHSLFEEARAKAPTVLYFDEIDALAADRHDMRRSAGRTTINQFLSELDGSTASNEGVLVFGATNSPWHLDPAFRRPGRFDRILFAPPPDAKGREAILEILLRNRPHDTIDFAKLAKKSDGFSGADLRSVVERACDLVLTESLRSGKAPAPLSTSHLLDAVSKTKSSTKGWFETARNYAVHANHDGQYNDVLEHLGLKP